MNKVATYLNEHLTGEVITQPNRLKEAETDGGFLMRRPEMIVRAAATNDIRKVMRFCSQLAEKGHVLPVAVRGSGTDVTSATLTNGAVIDTTTYLNRVIGIDPKQQLIHVQAGIKLSAVNAALATHKGLGLPSVSYHNQDGTIGGAIATAATGMSSGGGNFFDAIRQLEIILSTGETIQTERLSKRELSKKKGLATFEGEIYREIDNLITDNAELIEKIGSRGPNSGGFANIARVKRKDGSFDLTPLFIGSQGSLGIVSEVIAKAEFVRPEATVVAASYSELLEAQSAIDQALSCKASAVELIDGRIFRRAHHQGKTIKWAPQECYDGAVVLAVFDDFSERTRAKLAKKLLKKLQASNTVEVSQFELEQSELVTLHAALSLAKEPAGATDFVPRMLSGIWLPTVRMASFADDLAALEAKFDVDLPMFIDYSRGYVAIYPQLDSKKVSHRQKALHLLAEVAKLVNNHEGSFAGFGGDGVTKAVFMRKIMPAGEKQLYDNIKAVFDPFGILCPGVKSDGDIKQLAAELNAWCINYNK